MAVLSFHSVAFVFLSAAVLVYLRSKKSKLPPGTKSLPGPRGFPLIGSVPSLPSQHPWLKFTEWGVKHGPIYQVNLAGDNCVFISSPKIAEDLLVKRQAIYSSRPHFAAIAGDNRTNMQYLPLLANGSNHQRAKLFAKKLMSGTPRQHLITTSVQQTKKLLLNLLTTPSDFQHHLELCTSSISSQMAWGNNTKAVAQETLQRANDLVVGISPEAIENKLPFLRKIPDWVPGFLQPWKVEEDARFERERNFWGGMRTSVRNQGEEAGYSWTRETLKLKESPLDDREATYSVGMLALIGGMLVSSPIQAWFLAMCHYPEWQRRGQQEVDAVCGSRMPDAGDIENMPVVRALIRETMRWRSPVPFGVPHLLEEDDVYEGYYLPKGSQVFALEWALNNDATLFPDPEIYNPDRWLNPKSPSYRTPLSTYPQIKGHSGFGWGRRTCVGQDHSETVLFTVIAGILWGCDIKTGTDGEGRQVKAPWLDYGEHVIVRPKAWSVSVEARDEWRLEALRGVEEKMGSGW